MGLPATGPAALWDPPRRCMKKIKEVRNHEQAFNRKRILGIFKKLEKNGGLHRL